MTEANKASADLEEVFNEGRLGLPTSCADFVGYDPPSDPMKGPEGQDKRLPARSPT